MEIEIKFEPNPPLKKQGGYYDLCLNGNQVGKILKDLFRVFNPSTPIDSVFFDTFTNDDNCRTEYFVNSYNQGFEIDVLTDEYDFRDPYNYFFGCELINIDGYELSVRPFCEYGGLINQGKFISRSNIIFKSFGNDVDFNKKFDQILTVIMENNLKIINIKIN